LLFDETMTCALRGKTTAKSPPLPTAALREEKEKEKEENRFVGIAKRLYYCHATVVFDAKMTQRRQRFSHVD